VTKFDKSQLNKEMAQLSSSAFYIGVAKADAEYEMDKAKAKLKVTNLNLSRSFLFLIRSLFCPLWSISFSIRKPSLA
jgi:hypothetical protein